MFGCDTAPMEMTARDALRVATRGGAQVLGRSDIGHLSPGMCADLALFDLCYLSDSTNSTIDLQTVSNSGKDFKDISFTLDFPSTENILIDLSKN